MSQLDTRSASFSNQTEHTNTTPKGHMYVLSELNDFSLQSLHLNDPIEVLGLPLRLENYLKNGGKIKTLKDFRDYPNEKLIKIKNVGQKTQQFFIELKEKISQQVKDVGLSSKVQSKELPNKISPADMVDLLLSQSWDERMLNVVVKRYGLRGEEKHTLEEIGQLYELTRERIRQIQVKALKRMNGAQNSAKHSIIRLVEEALYINDGILSEEEADLQIPSALEEKHDDGSSVLDLLSDLGWIQSSKIGDIVIYSPLFDGVKLEKISERIAGIVESENLGIDLLTLTKKVNSFKRINDERFEPQKFVLRYCRIDPRIQEVSLSNETYPLFRHYSHSGNFTKRAWVELMKRVLETEQMPLHFTEIANRVNDLLNDLDKQLDVRRAHSMLIEDKVFAHTGIRGTYGLTEWGLRRESTPQLIEECIRKAGFPLHWKQIYNYVSKYKDSKPGSIISVLEVNPTFQKVDSGIYGLQQKSA